MKTNELSRSRWLRNKSRRNNKNRLLRIEQLETRKLLTGSGGGGGSDGGSDGGGDGGGGTVCPSSNSYVVNSISDPIVDINPLVTTLREAIVSANGDPGHETICFNIPGQPDDGDILTSNDKWWTIDLVAPLPALTDNAGVTIDGFTQTTSQGNTNAGMVGTGGFVGVDKFVLPKYQKTEIAIDGNTWNAFTMQSSNNLVKGMAVYNAGLPGADGWAVQSQTGATNNTAKEMLIGTLPDGSDPDLLLPPQRNGSFGAQATSGAQLTVTKSYVGYNGQGGLDGFKGTSVVTFTYNEVFANGWATDSHDGIDINGINSTAKYNLTHDNTNNVLLGTVAKGGGGNGIELGSQAAATGFNEVKNNTTRGNLSAGISIRNGASGNLVLKNVVYKNEVGVSVNAELLTTTNRNSLSQNRIYENKGLGIDLQWRNESGEWVGETGTLTGPDGPNDDEATGQDDCDLDGSLLFGGVDGTPTNTESNDLQNYPELTSAVRFGGATKGHGDSDNDSDGDSDGDSDNDDDHHNSSPSGNETTVIQGKLNSVPGHTYLIEFFSTPDAVLSNAADREGKDFIGDTFVTIPQCDEPCEGTFTATFNVGMGDNRVITATARRFTSDNAPWSTSEFSKPKEVNNIDMKTKVNGNGHYYHDNDPNTKDKASFNVSARYQQNNPVPVGKTTLEYNQPNGQKLKFSSTAYDSLSLLVTEGEPNEKHTQWSGQGKLNNQSGYSFEVQVTDQRHQGGSDGDDDGFGDDKGQSGAPDSFRIKISNTSTGEVIYNDFKDHPKPAGILGSAESFGTLAAATVTNTGSTVVTGNLGVSPGTAVTGFGPGIVMAPATIHSASAVALQAQTDVTSAFNNLAGRASTVDLTGQNLGGKTLTPGVYNFASSAQLTGKLTLDALGNPNAEFIFKMGSTITTASNASVVMKNGADGRNVFWHVGSSATLGTGTKFAGSILANASITLNTGASIVCGRAVARTGAVTMDTNKVSTDGCTKRNIEGGNIQVRMNPNGLQAAGAAENTLAGSLTAEGLEPIITEATARWQEAGVDELSLSSIAAVNVHIADLPAGILGLSGPGFIAVDLDGGGFGWFIDATPGDDLEFSGFGHDLVAQTGQDSFGRMDLLTAVTHEFGHQLGFGHSHENDTMHDTLVSGERHLAELEHSPVSFVTSFDANELSSSIPQVLLISDAMHVASLTSNWSINHSATSTAMDQVFGQTANWRSNSLIDASERHADLLNTEHDGIADRIASGLLKSALYNVDSQDSRDLSSHELLAESLELCDRETLARRHLVTELIADVQDQLLPQIPHVQGDSQHAAPSKTAGVVAQRTEQEAEEARVEDSAAELTLTEAELEHLMIDLLDRGQDQVAAADAVYAEMAL